MIMQEILPQLQMPMVEQLKISITLLDKFLKLKIRKEIQNTSTMIKKEILLRELIEMEITKIEAIILMVI